MADAGAILDRIRQVLSDQTLKEVEELAKQSLASLGDARALSAAIRQLETPAAEAEEQEPIVGLVRLTTTTFDNGIISVEMEPDSQLLRYMLVRQWPACEEALARLGALADSLSDLTRGPLEEEK